MKFFAYHSAFNSLMYQLFRVNDDADVCVECMVQTAMKYSPHLEWIVAHIG